MNDISNNIEVFRELILKSERIVFFTGAGVSTESGIPDFRSPGTGIWNKISPIEFQDFLASEEKRKESWRRKFNSKDTMGEAKPNKGHLAIAKLINSGKATSVITQNVDNLHERAGVDESKMVHLHGNAHYATCLECGLRFELAALKKEFEDQGTVDPCRECGGIIKTATISFGQQMPIDEMDRASVLTRSSDLFVVIGSSLIVYPAASFPELAAHLGIPLVILNREPTPLDHLATLVLHEEIGPTMEWVTRGLN